MTTDFEVSQPGEVAGLRQRVKELELALHAQAEGAAMYLTAVVAHAVGVDVEFRIADEDMRAVIDEGLQLERADPDNGDLILRVVRPEQPELKEPEKKAVSAIITELNPVLAKAERPIILLDSQRPPNE